MLRRTILSQSLLLAFASTSLTVAMLPQASAQSTVTGSIFGQAGAAGDQVLIENTETGLRRTVPVENGSFRATTLPAGHYRAQLLKGGAVVSSIELDVLAGGGAEAIFAGTRANELQTVRIVGRAPSIDVSSTTNRTTFTAKDLANIPVATQNLNGIIALAANTTRADSRYAGGISIGGGAPSENSYYVNGFPTTNALTQLGSIELPYAAIAQADVQTGGFGAEFGRSVGGVVNVTTKSGTNDFHGGASVYYEPNSLRSKPKDSLYNSGGNPTTDGMYSRYRGDNSRDEYRYGAYLGGPILKDKLFFFFAGDVTKTSTGGTGVASDASAVTARNTGWLEEKDKDQRYLGKIDWYITPDHRLEFTAFGDNYYTNDDYYAFNYGTLSKGAYSYSEYSKNLASVTPSVGGEAKSLRYIGNITDDLTVTALYGQSSSKHLQSYSFAPTSPMVLVPNATNANPTILGGVYPSANPLPGGTTGVPNGAQDSTKSFRLDGEYKLGRHTIRAGLDENRLKSENAGENYANTGGYYWRYGSTRNGAFKGTGPGAQTLIQAGAVPVNGTYYYVRGRVFDDATAAQSDQSAQYIEDRYQVTDRVLVTGGLRREGFKNKNGDGATFLESKNFFSPRVSAGWDVMGDSSLKVFGSAGRYSLQIPTHVAVRGASRSLFTDQYFAYTGVDPVTGAPTGTTALAARPYSANNEYGQAKDPRAVSAQGIKPTYQDELTLGMEKALTSTLSGGVKLTYRKLQQTIDDWCDSRVIDAYAAAHNISEANYGGFNCASINPGQSAKLLVDYAGTGNFQEVNLSAADIGLPKARRTYFALDFFLEHALRDNWYGKVNYTYSKSKGNTEGQTKSDNAQTDVAATSTWDYPELMEGSYGRLPNDRTHQIKAYGYYQLTPEWGFGSTVLAESGRPKNCFGNYPDPTSDAAGYGSVFFYCGTGQLDAAGKPIIVSSPRGSQGNLPWNFSLDMNAVYKPTFAKGLALRVDVFNLFNRQTAQVVDETHENSGDSLTVIPTYNRVISYSAPRKVRLTAEYNF